MKFTREKKRKEQEKFSCENIFRPMSINYRDVLVRDGRELFSVDKYFFKKHMKNKACLLALSPLHLHRNVTSREYYYTRC